MTDTDVMPHASAPTAAPRDPARRSRERILMVIGVLPASARLIRTVRRLAEDERADLYAAHVDTGYAMTGDQRRTLGENLRIVRSMNAEVLHGSGDLVEILSRMVREKSITQIVLSRNPRTRWGSLRADSIVDDLMERCPGVDVHVVPDRESEIQRLVLPFLRTGSPPGQYGAAAAVIGIVTLFNLAIAQWTSYFTPAIVYLFVLTLLGTFMGRGPLLLSAVMSALFWEFLFIPPRYTFYIERIEDILMLLAYFVTAAASSFLTWRIRRSKDQLEREERQMAALYELSRDLSWAVSVSDVSTIAVRHLDKAFRCPCRLLIAEEGSLVRMGQAHPIGEKDFKEMAIADWAFRQGRAAGRFTDTLPEAGARYVPLFTPGGVIGVVGLELAGPLDPLSENLLQTMSGNIAFAFERHRLAEGERSFRMAQESERLSRILMNTVSHELRSPLTAIMGASSALVDDTIAENKKLRHELLDELLNSSSRLNRLVNNLLDMSRLESGHMRLQRVRTNLRELVDECIAIHRRDLDDHVVEVLVDNGLPDVESDQELLVQALGCIIHNAAVHTPPQTRITIKGDVAPGQAVLTIEDNGPGVGDEELAGLFDRFYGGRRRRGTGAGLGLSLAKGIVELHGGSLLVKRGGEGGLLFTMNLPASATAEGVA